MNSIQSNSKNGSKRKYTKPAAPPKQWEVFDARQLRRYSHVRPTVLPKHASRILWKSGPGNGKIKKMKMASKIRIETESKAKPRKTCGRTQSERINETKRQAPIAACKKFG
jgi:hypothetical protein